MGQPTAEMAHREMVTGSASLDPPREVTMLETLDSNLNDNTVGLQGILSRLVNVSDRMSGESVSGSVTSCEVATSSSLCSGQVGGLFGHVGDQERLIRLIVSVVEDIERV